ncbi:hypothetical protein [Steroidobacter agaridevorans]|uniref:hypothetical protein n=1 Tax=Steroidobacter agaridevorans TaxID=2695856 RepID=UPI0013287900|nr:hypothetical protein [Steroidobacter agaridevorans]GFE85221.1 hypothetical protein GCM10011488_01750 [Steroidobacter agaridevorans]
MTVVKPNDPDTYGELARRLRDDANDSVLSEYRSSFEQARDSARQRLHEPLPADEFRSQQALAQCTDLSIEVLNAVHATLREG